MGRQGVRCAARGKRQHLPVERCPSERESDRGHRALQLRSEEHIFITPYNQEGLLPVFLVITNDGDQPVALTSMRAELVTAGRTKLESLTNDDVFRRVAHISGGTNAPPRVGPIPLPGNKNKKAQKQYEEILTAHFAAEAVEPHTTKSGFLFFDVAGVRQPVDGAHIYLTGINDAGGNELMYFEIPVTPSKAQ